MLETPLGWSLLLILGSFTGILSGLLGIGGGLLIVPALTLFGMPLVQATATSLVAVLLSSISGSWRNLSAGELNWRVSLLLAGFGILTAPIGARLAGRLPEAALSLAFAVLLLVTLGLMQLRQRLQRQELAARPSDAAPIRVAPTAGIGLLAGLLAGLFGVGGGGVMVPLQMLFLGENVKAAVRTSLGAIVAIAISGLIQHTLHGNVLWIPGICLGLGGILGAQFGTRLLPRLSERTVGLLFRGFLLGLAVYMALRSLA